MLINRIKSCISALHTVKVLFALQFYQKFWKIPEFFLEIAFWIFTIILGFFEIKIEIFKILLLVSFNIENWNQVLHQKILKKN